jgi:hypothetical protein
MPVLATDDSFTEEKTFGAWSGTREDLRRLGQTIEELFEDEVTRTREEYEHLTASGPIRSAVRRLFRRQPAQDIGEQLAEMSRVSLQVERESGEITNHYEKLLSQHDLTGVRGVTFSCYLGKRGCTLYLNNNILGCRLRLSGERGWVPGAMRAIEDEMRRNRAWWSALRKPGTGVVITVLIAIAAFGSFLGALTLLENLISLSGSAETVVVIGGSIAVTAGVAALVWAARLAFPAFEVREPGRSTTRRKLSRLIGVLAGGFLGLVSVAQGIAWLLKV